MFPTTAAWCSSSSLSASLTSLSRICSRSKAVSATARGSFSTVVIPCVVTRCPIFSWILGDTSLR